MSKFACIYFIENNIILSKDRSFKGKHPRMTIESTWYEQIESYNVTIYAPYQKLTQKNWQYLENQLLLKNVEYAYIQNGGKQNQLFEEIHIISGQEILPLTSYYILKYIEKYKLVPKDIFNNKVGIIAGELEETIDLIGNIMDDITDLTLFAPQPLIYKDIVIALHQKKRLKVRVVKPEKVIISKMDIVFDLKDRGIYATWCSPNAIYIDYKNKVVRYMDQIGGALPRIWYDFDIVWEGRLIKLFELQMILAVQGITGRSLRKEFKQLNLSIRDVYTRRIS